MYMYSNSWIFLELHVMPSDEPFHSPDSFNSFSKAGIHFARQLLGRTSFGQALQSLRATFVYKVCIKFDSIHYENPHCFAVLHTCSRNMVKQLNCSCCITHTCMSSFLPSVAVPHTFSLGWSNSWTVCAVSHTCPQFYHLLLYHTHRAKSFPPSSLLFANSSRCFQRHSGAISFGMILPPTR